MHRSLNGWPCKLATFVQKEAVRGKDENRRVIAAIHHRNGGHGIEPSTPKHR